MPPAIDTLKVSHRLQSAGMPRKQADVVVEALADVVEDRAGKDAMKEAVETLATAMDRRFTAIDKQHLVVRAEIDDVKAGQKEIMTMLAKILDGQSVLQQNDMELKRRMDERNI